MLKGGMSSFDGRRVLLLQGPLGPFFRRLAVDLERAGAKVFKVNFNGGDWFFYPRSAFNFRGGLDAWPEYFEGLLEQLDVDLVMLFGDCRPLHRIAHAIAGRRGIEIGVFEEGYVRPDHITLEMHGVNAHSRIPRSPVFYMNASVPRLPEQLPVGNTFWYVACWAILYYLAAALLKPVFPAYRHHRPLSCFTEGLKWVRSAFRKPFYRMREHGLLDRLTTEYSGRFFLVPLQTHNDAQIHVHSGFGGVDGFIEQVMTSFARKAPEGRILVFKHHPLDRGYSDYTDLIRRHAAALGLKGRCLYIHDQHLPTLLDHALGVVVVNSTVGLSALLHGAPVKVCGDALYDIEGLTFQRPLDEFWHAAGEHRPNPRLFRRFYDYLVLNTQLNGSFYKRLPIVGSATGLQWRARVDASASSGADESSRRVARLGDGSAP